MATILTHAVLAKQPGRYIGWPTIARTPDDKLLVVFHGGEPLLFGVDKLINFSRMIKEELATVKCAVDFGIQTNGVLLKEEDLEKFESENISVSLSLDGPKEMHDQHRIDHKGKPSFDRVYQALLLLQKYPKVFQGCIAVINPHFSPRALFKFFHDNEVKEFNILIPDANYISPPEGRFEQADLYKKWLLEAFDCWFDEFPHLRCKYFDWMLKAALGHPSETDSFGLGDICMLVLETDGTYHNHDVLKITEEEGSALGLSLENNSIKEAETAEQITQHRHLLTKKGLSTKCQECKYVDVCGGGFVAHRFNINGYKNPSVYCDELYSLIDHITARVTRHLEGELKRLKEFSASDMEEFFNPSTCKRHVDMLREHKARKTPLEKSPLIPFEKISPQEKFALLEERYQLFTRDGIPQSESLRDAFVALHQLEMQFDLEQYKHLEKSLEEIRKNASFTRTGQLFYDCLCTKFTCLHNPNLVPA